MILTDRGGGRGQKDPKYADFMFEQPLCIKYEEYSSPTNTFQIFSSLNLVTN